MATSDQRFESIRVYYRPVTDDLPNGSKHLGDEQSVDLTEWEFEENDAGDVTYVRGTTADGRDVYAPVPNHHKSTVRARDRDEGAYRIHLGWVQDICGVTA